MDPVKTQEPWNRNREIYLHVNALSVTLSSLWLISLTMCISITTVHAAARAGESGGFVVPDTPQSFHYTPQNIKSHT